MGVDSLLTWAGSGSLLTSGVVCTSANLVQTGLLVSKFRGVDVCHFSIISRLQLVG